MKMKRRWFSSYIDGNTHEKFYSEVRKTVENDKLVDGYRHTVRSFGGTIGGIYRSLPHSELFKIHKSMYWPGFRLKEKNLDKEKGSIYIKKKAGLSYGAKIFIDFYYFNGGHWAEVKCEPLREGIDLFSQLTETTKFILDKLANLPALSKSEPYMKLEGLRQLEDRINEVLN